jgi:hypothetical protein
MENTYHFQITFSEVNFDKFISHMKPSALSHKATLITRENEIEIRIFYDSITYFGEKLSIWASKINWRKFGSFISTCKEDRNHRLRKIDFSDSSLLGMSNSSNHVDGKLKFVIVRVDSVKLYWEPLEDELNTAEFYLDDNGFNVVKDFYSTLSGEDGQFDISRMNGKDQYYQIEESEFRPEFHFCWNDSIDARESTIVKEPKIQFHYKDGITEEKAIKYAEIVRDLASFYFHLGIHYVFCKIHLKHNTITIKKVQRNNNKRSPGNLWAFKSYSNFHDFLKSNWQIHSISNHARLSKVIELFNQSHIVDNSSKFLIRFNIIEVCMAGRKSIEEKFVSALSGSEINLIYEEALELLRKTVQEEDRFLFEKKWYGIKSKLLYKPMTSPLETFLKGQKIDIHLLPIPIDRLKKIRDCLTYGSIDRIAQDELEQSNILLYRIAGILILNLLGIEKWELNTKISKKGL